jgi:heptosyltransferase I
MANQTPMRILIIKPSALGDVATTLPLLCDLKRAYPESQIDWLIHPAFIPLIQNHDALSAIVPFDRKNLAAWWYKPSAFKLFRQLLKTLRQNNYDLVIDAQGLFRSAYLANVTRAKTRIGFASAREGATFFYTHKVALPNNGKKMLAVDRMRALTSPLHIDTTTPAEFRMPIPPLPNIPLPPNYIALIPGARWNTKRWPIDRYTQLAQQILDAGHPLVILGSPDEKPLCDQLEKALITQDQARSTPILLNLAGQTTLAEMIPLLNAAKLVIGNDSGPLHVAIALGKQTLSLYGPTDPAFVGPYNQLQNVLRHDVPCFPCRNRDCSHHSCMNGLNVELVWEKTASLLPSSQTSN